MRVFAVLLSLVLLVASACTGGGATDLSSQQAASSTTTSPVATPNVEQASERTRAPEFPEGLDWLNVDEPLDLASLRGKIVLLDFWTYGCINCIHIIPDLKRLETEFPDELVVIGVHSAKFTNEGDTNNIREVTQRYDLRHPVVNDADFEIWNSWGARAWPTVALIDPDGYAVGLHAGEGVYQVVQPVISTLLQEFDGDGQIDPTPISLALERDRSPDTVLSYPGKVYADPASDRLFIADTGHHRIIAATDDGAVTAVFGSGREGFEDGRGTRASFSSPQGLLADGDTLYVADTNNHALRSIDLATGIVTTLAGTGEQGWPPVGGPVGEVTLNSPWALELAGDELYVANAGTHQIWTINLTTGTAEPSVGSAAEGTTNGPLLQAELAQPSGLAFGADGMLYFADSESSSIRGAAVAQPAGETVLVAGGETNLFEFGDVDGTGADARFQHPLGIDDYAGTLLVADTYNSKIKLVDPATGQATTLFGSEQGWSDGNDPQFYEPGGLSVDGDLLWVADTNNHVIRMIDLTTSVATTLVLSGLDALAAPSDSETFPGTVVPLPTVSAAAGPAELLLDVRLPEGYKVNDDASSSVTLADAGGVSSFPGGKRVDVTGRTFPVSIPLELREGLGTVTADLALVWCRKDAEGLCLLEQTRFEIPLDVAATGPSASIRLPLDLTAPER
ncbi:MAG: thioredoxin-like domain-containing protein [Acidimicrobiia bacterium]